MSETITDEKIQAKETHHKVRSWREQLTVGDLINTQILH